MKIQRAVQENGISLAVKCNRPRCALRQGKVHQKKLNGDFMCGCSIAPVISAPAVHPVLVPFLMNVEEE